MDFEQLLEIHKKNISKQFVKVEQELKKRDDEHDVDKLSESEIYETYKNYYPELKAIPFGSKEYKEFEQKHFKKAHYLHVQNRHHYYSKDNSLSDVNIIDLLESIIDISVSSKQYSDNSNEKIVEIIKNKGICDLKLADLIYNTLEFLDGKD